jgi:hypothetical protein
MSPTVTAEAMSCLVGSEARAGLPNSQVDRIRLTVKLAEGAVSSFRRIDSRLGGPRAKAADLANRYCGRDWSSACIAEGDNTAPKIGPLPGLSGDPMKAPKQNQKHDSKALTTVLMVET